MLIILDLQGSVPQLIPGLMKHAAKTVVACFSVVWPGRPRHLGSGGSVFVGERDAGSGAAVLEERSFHLVELQGTSWDCLGLGL